MRDQFIAQDTHAKRAFKANGSQWLSDLCHIAKLRLQSLGIMNVYGEALCTYSNPDQFFSYRRDGDTGRMATMIWLSA